MKTNLKRATVVLLVIAGLTALHGSKAFTPTRKSRPTASRAADVERPPQASSTLQQFQ
jgi:hypothetical protein